MIEIREQGFNKSFEAYLVAAVKGLRLDDWHIVFESHQSLGDDPNGGVTRADCEANARYQHALIRLTPHADGVSAVHELVHVLTANTSQAAERIIGMLPEGLREVAWEIFCDGLEPDIERLTGLLHPLVVPSEQKPSPSPSRGEGDEEVNA